MVFSQIAICSHPPCSEVNVFHLCPSLPTPRQIYDSNTHEAIKLNDIIEVYGILEHARSGGGGLGLEDCLQDEKSVEPMPRVHALVTRRLAHNNPLLPVDGHSQLTGNLCTVEWDVSSLQVPLMHSLFDSNDLWNA